MNSVGSFCDTHIRKVDFQILMVHTPVYEQVNDKSFRHTYTVQHNLIHSEGKHRVHNLLQIIDKRILSQLRGI
ncbi:hypothetical protein CHS0354_029221 [Potamilus streckersoni]|uniref:Uncharacterized protein n=1 Tax=Potamilus streckersoni TaxID=2493646 RepID=A0AAE0SU63_9BIVA|nr:hypothetical protein CHS0354_029221 [Potamilus streckersoni]